MNILYKISILFLCCVTHQVVIGQQALKRDKQVTKFHYLQTNLHLGYVEEDDINYFDLSNQGPSNNVTYRFLSKNQRLLQKGYTKLVAVNDFRARFSIQFNGGLNDKNLRNDVYSLNPQNLGVSFATKWDRTSFFVGYNRVQFGHNPKIDPVSDFTANSTRNDIGFNQDLGVFFKTPITSNVTGEINASIGGTVSKPILTYDSTTGHSDFIDINYNGTWLLTGRIGTPSFKSFEYGLIAMAGRLQEDIGDTTRRINRLGFDILKKQGEQWKIGMLAVVGNTETSTNLDAWNYNFQQTIEYYLKGKYIFNISNGLLINDFKENTVETTINGQWINSFSYVVSPHTRLRVNHFTNYSKSNHPDWGVSFQLITGFGKR